MEHLRAAENGHVVELSFSDGSAVVADDAKVVLSVAERLHDGLETNFWLVLSVVFPFDIFYLSIFIYDLNSY